MTAPATAESIEPVAPTPPLCASDLFPPDPELLVVAVPAALPTIPAFVLVDLEDPREWLPAGPPPPPPAGALQVWSLTQFYSVDFSQTRIGVKKCVFNKRTIKVCVSC